MLSRPTKTLLALLALSSFAQAGWFDNRLNEVIRRQENSAVSPSASVPEVTPTVSTPIDTPTETPTPTPTPSATPTPTPTPSATPSTTPSATPSSTTPSVSSTTPPSSSSSSSVEEEETSSTQPSSSEEEQTTAPPTTASPSRTVVRVTQTRTVDGSTITSVSESTSTTFPTSTSPAGLANGSETSGGGMSSKTKSTVIGVVVGIGGAILLAGLAVVAWRIWGRRKNNDEGDDLMDYRPDTAAEKGGSSAGASSNPFQSTLENYHNPAKQVNASSNF